MNGKVAETWGYLVLDGLDEKTILETIKAPEMEIPNELYFKDWTGYLPEVSRRTIIMTANFGLTEYKESPIVLGPSRQRIFVENQDDYRMVAFFTIGGGYLNVDNVNSANLHYLIKENHTWGEILDKISLPKPIALDGYEFIEWVIAGYDVNEPNKIPKETNTSDMDFLYARALFGKVEPNLGDYIPEDQNNPLSNSDRNIPNPGDYNNPYDPSKYVRVAFSAGEHGSIVNFFGDSSKSTVYLVRKGLTLREAMVYAPSVEAKEGFKANDWNIDMDKPINEDTLFTVTYSESKDKVEPTIPNSEKEITTNSLDEKKEVKIENPKVNTENIDVEKVENDKSTEKVIDEKNIALEKIPSEPKKEIPSKEIKIENEITIPEKSEKNK